MDVVDWCGFAVIFYDPFLMIQGYSSPALMLRCLFLIASLS
jgi:hypothetical protein